MSAMREAFKPRWDTFKEEDDTFDTYQPEAVGFTVIEGGKRDEPEAAESSSTDTDVPTPEETDTGANAPEENQPETLPEISATEDEPIPAPEVTSEVAPTVGMEQDVPTMAETLAMIEAMPKEAVVERARTLEIEDLQALGSQAKEIFGTMSDKGRAVAGALYEGINRIPGVSRLTAKAEIAYNQFFITHHERVAAIQGEKIADLSARASALNETARELEGAIETLKGLSNANFESLQKKVSKFYRERSELLSQQAQLELRQNERVTNAERFIAERDRVADRLINTYQEKLSLVDARVEKLRDDQEHLALQIEAAEHLNQDELKRLAAVEEQKKIIEQALIASGQSLAPLRSIEQEIRRGRETIAKKQAEYRDHMNTMKERINAAEAKGAPFKTRKQEFINLKRATTLPERPQPVFKESQSPQPDAAAPERTETPEGDETADFMEFLSEYIENGNSSPEETESSSDIISELIRDDVQFQEFLMDVFTGNYSDSEQSDLIHQFSESDPDRYAAESEETAPLIFESAAIALPNSATRLRISSTRDNRIVLNLIK
ncbi:MAG TPA: hypothetical protein VGE31_00525 [Candidatus Paceibacterota bacterium]